MSRDRWIGAAILTVVGVGFVVVWVSLCAQNGLLWTRDLALTAVLVVCLAGIARLRWTS